MAGERERAKVAYTMHTAAPIIALLSLLSCCQDVRPSIPSVCPVVKQLLIFSLHCRLRWQLKQACMRAPCLNFLQVSAAHQAYWFCPRSMLVTRCMYQYWHVLCSVHEL